MRVEGLEKDDLTNKNSRKWKEYQWEKMTILGDRETPPMSQLHFAHWDFLQQIRQS